MANTLKFSIVYESVDGLVERRQYNCARSASKWARERIGDHPEIGRGYAVSGDGVGKIYIGHGDVTLRDLFPGAL